MRWEVFNLLNRVNFDVPNRTAFTPNFGRIFSAGPARQMQLGVKLIFQYAYPPASYAEAVE